MVVSVTTDHSLLLSEAPVLIDPLQHMIGRQKGVGGELFIEKDSQAERPPNLVEVFKSLNRSKWLIKGRERIETNEEKERQGTAKAT